jgi:catechol 2,3-dioxygenase-like lactoylglutathione lyase family enzyme
MRRAIRSIGLFFTLAFTLGIQAQQPLVTAVGPIGITVSDMERSLDFYTRVLPFKKLSDEEFAGENLEHVKGVFGLRIRVVRLQLGDEQVELTQYLAPRGRPVAADSRSNDRWFQHVAIIVRNMDKAYAWLRQNKVQYASTGPQTLPDWNKNAAGIKAFYFRDPDDHNLEILWFPEGKGQPKWHKPGDDLFMGIDHTAIVVKDTETSLHFYGDLLGLRVAGESENYGSEQEHLNNVFGAHLRITTLRAASGPGIELLEYLAPRDGRPIPADLRANDTAHWETTVIADGDRVALSALLKKADLISSDLEEITLAGHRTQEVIFKDPDGHAVALISEVEEHRAGVCKHQPPPPSRICRCSNGAIYDERRSAPEGIERTHAPLETLGPVSE